MELRFWRSALAQTKAHKHGHRSRPNKLDSAQPPMGPVTYALNRAIEVAHSALGGTGGLQAEMQKLHCNKNTRMHTTHTHTRTPQTELKDRSERNLRFSTNESTQAWTPKHAKQTLWAERLDRRPVQAPRNVERSVLQHRRREGLRDVDLEENLRGRRQQHPEHQPVGQQPAEGPVQAFPAPQPPPGGCLLGSPVPASPTVAVFALFSCHNSSKETLGRGKCKSNTHHAKGRLKRTEPPDLDLACYVIAPIDSSSLYCRKTSCNSAPPLIRLDPRSPCLRKHKRPHGDAQGPQKDRLAVRKGPQIAYSTRCSLTC